MALKLHGVKNVTPKNNTFVIPYPDFKEHFYPFGYNPKTRTVDFPKDEKDFSLIEFLKNGGNAGPILATKERCEDGTYKYPFYDGERRSLAYKYLYDEGFVDIKVSVQVDPNMIKDKRSMLASVVSTSNGKKLTPSERAEIFRRLYDWKWSYKEIAENCGLSAQSVQNIINLSYAIPEIKKELDKGGISQKETSLIVEKSKGDPDKQEEMFEEFKNEKKEGKRTLSGRKKRRSKTDRRIENHEYEEVKPPKNSDKSNKDEVNKVGSILDETCGPKMMDPVSIKQWYDKLNMIVERSHEQEIIFDTLGTVLGYNVCV
jgi:hypothetical protein